MGRSPKLTEDRRTQTVQVEELRHQLKKGSEEVAGLKRDKQPADSRDGGYEGTWEKPSKDARNNFDLLKSSSHTSRCEFPTHRTLQFR